MFLNILNLSRLQFAITAFYHFIFVSSSIGLSILLAITETIYYITNNKIYKDIVIFFGKIFSLSFAIGVSTGLIMELQFGTNWSYFSRLVGGSFGIPLVLEGIIAFFLESTLIGLFFFGWNKLSKIQHLIISWLIVLGSNLSALWILMANGWMQNPISSNFNPIKMTIDINNFYNLIFNKVSQVKFFHTIMSCYCFGAIIIISISSYYLLNNKHIIFFKESFKISSLFFIFVIIFTIILGDESGYELNKIQKSKLAAIESEWNTNKAPASLNLFCIPSQKNKKNYFSIKIPYLAGILITRSKSEKIIGLNKIIKKNKLKIIKGIKAIKFLKKIKNSKKIKNININIKNFNLYKKYIGFGLLYNKYYPDLVINNERINIISNKTIPKVWPLFFSFRIMILCGILLLILSLLSIYKIITNTFNKNIWIYKILTFSFPIPIIASISGWFVSEYGRQPWIIYEIFPTELGISNINKNEIILSIFSILILYVIILILLIYLIRNILIKGPKNINL